MKVKEFAEKVERLCEFLLDRVPTSEEREEVIKLRDAAADLQFDSNCTNLFEGLSDHMRGIHKEQ